MLPADVQKVLDQYDTDVQAGIIRFGETEFADQYPGRDAAHASLAAHIRAHVSSYAGDSWTHGHI